MKIVIDIDERAYVWLKNGYPDEKDGEYAISIISNGIPLPKNYGRLIILSEDKMKEHQIKIHSFCQNWINEVSLSNATVAIIEAESEDCDWKVECNNKTR